MSLLARASAFRRGYGRLHYTADGVAASERADRRGAAAAHAPRSLAARSRRSQAALPRKRSERGSGADECRPRAIDAQTGMETTKSTTILR